MGFTQITQSSKLLVFSILILLALNFTQISSESSYMLVFFEKFDEKCGKKNRRKEKSGKTLLYKKIKYIENVSVSN